MQTKQYWPAVLLAALLATAALAQETTQVQQSSNDWYTQGEQTLQQMLNTQPNTNQAKNVIIFISDGADSVVHTASRILDGQLQGQDGESNVLSFENFPNVALVKTYNVNAQVPDSAGTATAWNSGVKTDMGVLGASADVERGDCASMQGNEVTLLFELAEQAGMSTGNVSTARITHATPAATYAHSPDRDWEDDGALPDEAKQQGCTDIASQLVNFPFGDGMEVALGGGRRHFMPDTMADPENEGEMGNRADGQDLPQVWLDKQPNSAYVWNQEQFDAVDPAQTDHLLGLFERSHMQYESDRADDPAGEPSLSQMTSKAIDILSKNDQGYVLQVEAGRVDHALHGGNAYRALTDDIEFARAVQTALDKVNLDETLIIVTSDHGHVMTFAGYPERGNPVLGLVQGVGEEGGAGGVTLAADGKPYTTLGFYNGPGSVFAEDEEDAATGSETGGAQMAEMSRPDPSSADVQSEDYQQQAVVPLGSETHGGSDVAAYATGPQAFLVRGVVEQNYLFHVIDHALGLTERVGQMGGMETGGSETGGSETGGN